MSALVDYSSSSEEEATTPPRKKRKVSSAAEEKTSLPPLPASFLDQYSSTVRTSAQDDPSLHGGRKRVTPHVQGNWPTHVYLEWYLNKNDSQLLADVVSAVQARRTKRHDPSDDAAHSLLENDLGVALPLHVSLSRPLTLKTEQKDAFISRLQQFIDNSSVRAFDVIPKDLAWHSNENETRWFLVLRLQRPVDDEMARLLEVCNGIADDFAQPLLYGSKDKRGKVLNSPGVSEKFHISVAWALQPLGVTMDQHNRRQSSTRSDDVGVPYELLARLNGMRIAFGEVKVRIGQDVHNVPLKAPRKRAPSKDDAVAAE